MTARRMGFLLGSVAREISSEAAAMQLCSPGQTDGGGYPAFTIHKRVPTMM